MEQINIETIHELENEIDKDDIETLLNDNNLTPENLEKKIAKLDSNPKELSETEKKLYNILKEIHGIVSLKNILNKIHEKIRTTTDIGYLEEIKQYKKNIEFIKRKSKELKIQIDPTIQKKMEKLAQIDPYKLNSNDLEKYYNKMINLRDKFRDTTLEEPKEKIPKNITIEELKNRFKNSNLKESMEIIKYMYDNNKKSDEFNIIKSSKDKEYILVDIYLDSLTEQGKYKEVEEFLDSEISKNLIGYCASPTKVLEIRNEILKRKKADLIKMAREHYKETGDDHTLSDGLINIINEQIKKKKTEEGCAIDFITAISDFEKRHKELLEKRGIKKLTGSEIQQFIDKTLSLKKSENDSFMAKGAKALNMDEGEFKEKVQNNNFDETERKKLKAKGINILKLHEKLKSNTYIANIRTKVDNFSEEEIKFITQHPGVDSKTLKKQIDSARKGELTLESSFDNSTPSSPLTISTFTESEKDNTYNIEVNGIKLEGLTQKEIQKIGINKDKKGNVIIENPDILENTINFYKFFKDLNLLGVWEYRKELVNAIGDVNINLNDDSLKKKELINFGNKLIKFINNLPNQKGEEKQQLSKNNNSISSLKKELKDFSKSGNVLSKHRTFNNLGEDILIANLRNLGILGGACFHTIQFRDIMNGKINPNKENNKKI